MSNPHSAGGGVGSGLQSGHESGGSAMNQGGHSISQSSGPIQFSNMQIPGLTFPADTQQIQQAVGALPPQERQQWSETLSSLPPDHTYNSLQDLQQACQQASQRIEQKLDA